jgi:hypothetical protein
MSDDSRSQCYTYDVTVKVNEVNPPSQNQQYEDNNDVENNDNTFQVEEIPILL